MSRFSGWIVGCKHRPHIRHARARAHTHVTHARTYARKKTKQKHGVTCLSVYCTQGYIYIYIYITLWVNRPTSADHG